MTTAVAAIAKRHRACPEGVAWLRAQPDLATAAAACPPHYAYWLRRYVPDLPADVARQAEQAAMRDPKYAYRLRRYVRNLPDDVMRAAEQAAMQDPEYAYWLRRDVRDLPPAVARQAEQVARGGTGARP
jgi:hypothetical protein